MEYATLIVSILSLIISALALYSNAKTSGEVKTLMSERTLLHNGQIEISVRNMITDSKNRFEDISYQILNCETVEQKSLLSKNYHSAIESLSNAYDEACAKYLDSKIDKERFKKMYITELRNWVELDEVKDKYVRPQTKFNATVSVYEEWNNLEKSVQ